jgi:hypothetical protein
MLAPAHIPLPALCPPQAQAKLSLAEGASAGRRNLTYFVFPLFSFQGTSGLHSRSSGARTGHKNPRSVGFPAKMFRAISARHSTRFPLSAEAAFGPIQFSILSSGASPSHQLA